MTTRTLVMAVPWKPERATRALELQAETGAEIVWDETRSGWDTWKKVLHTAGTDPVIIVEDDVRLVPGWRGAVEQVIEEHGEFIVKFACMNPDSTLTYPCPKRSRLRSGSMFWGLQCTYLPSGMALSLLQEMDLFSRYRPDHDIAVGAYLTHHNLPYWQHMPSLVQHERDWVSAVRPGRPARWAHDLEVQ